MSQKKVRRRTRTQRNAKLRAIASHTQQWEYVLCDQHTRHEVKILNLICIHQLVNRGMAELVKGRIARLHPRLRLTSNELHANGQPQIEALPKEGIWAKGSSCVTEAVCRILWLFSDAPAWGIDLRYTLDHKDAAEAARIEQITEETKSWGLPAERPVHLRYGFHGIDAGEVFSDEQIEAAARRIAEWQEREAA